MPPKGFEETRVVGHFSLIQGMSNTETGHERLRNGCRQKRQKVETITMKTPWRYPQTPQKTVLYPALASSVTYSATH